MNYKILYIIIAAVIALLLAAFLYVYKNKKMAKINWLLFVLRALSFFLIFLLLFNLKITKRILKNEKPNLFVLVDNSKSIALEGKANSVHQILKKIKKEQTLANKFNLQFYSFSNKVKPLDSATFTGNETKIRQALQTVNSFSISKKSPIVLISDGNQTIGSSYKFYKTKHTIYPIVIGDTTSFQDVFIDRLNANKYAYLKHKFPVEIFVAYQGQKNNLPVTLQISEGKKIIYKQKIKLGKDNNSKHLSFYLPANKTGLHHYLATVSGIKDEKNKHNNKKYFTVNVISEKAEILLISDIIHPDIALFKRAIESNEQRKLTIKKPTDHVELKKYKSVILYQPKTDFKTVIKQLLQAKKNIFFVTGTHTNWNVLNDFQPFFKRDFVNKKEDYSAVFNTSFNTFLADDIGFESYPPIQDKFGEISFFVPHQVLLYQKINNFTTEQPLMAAFTKNKQRYIALFGENAWRWRLFEGKNKHQFKDFDTFINKSMQYLAAENKGDFLEIDYKNTYFSNQEISIKAQAFDLNYQFNPKKKLWIKINGNTKNWTFPFSLEANYYQVNITDLNPGNYHFTVYDTAKTISKSGSFTILNYEIEQQNTSGNYQELNLLAKNNSGSVFFPDQIDKLVSTLNKNTDFKTVQKEIIRKKSLIDWRILLALISILLSLEWFLRKYKGYV